MFSTRAIRLVLDFEILALRKQKFLCALTSNRRCSLQGSPPRDASAMASPLCAAVLSGSEFVQACQNTFENPKHFWSDELALGGNATRLAAGDGHQALCRLSELQEAERVGEEKLS